MKSKLNCSQKITIFTKTKPEIKKVNEGYFYVFTEVISFNTEKEITLKSTQSQIKEDVDKCKRLNYKIDNNKNFLLLEGYNE